MCTSAFFVYLLLYSIPYLFFLSLFALSFQNSTDKTPASVFLVLDHYYETKGKLKPTVVGISIITRNMVMTTIMKKAMMTEKLPNYHQVVLLQAQQAQPQQVLLQLQLQLRQSLLKLTPTDTITVNQK